MMLSLFQHHRARILSVVVALSLIVFLLQLYTSFPPSTSRGPELVHSSDPRPPTDSTPSAPETPSTPDTSSPGHDGPAAGPPSLPAEYLAGSSESAFCKDRYGLQYLYNARDSATSHCSAGSGSGLTCFWSKTAEGENRVDAMCVGTGASFAADPRRFRLDCALQNPDGAPAVPGGLTKYWYGTGPGHVVSEAVEFAEPSSGDHPRGPAARTTVLVHREGSHNLWHSLMEIMSTSWTLDTLRITPSFPAAAADAAAPPFLADADADSTQIVLLDDHPDGPYIDLWRLFAKLPIRRLKDLSSSSEPSSTDIVIPFAGGSNPLWQGDWTDLSCHDSPLVKTFIARTLAHLAIDPSPPRAPNVSVTFITRTTTRRLLREDAHVAALRAAIPHMDLTVVDFAALPLAGQLEAVRRTDLLVGVHGAGLTHLMFLQPGSGVVEILPEGFQHKGFRNLAQMLGHGYFRTHARKVRRRGVGADGDAGGDETDEEVEEVEEVEDAGEGREKRDGARKGRLRARDWQSEDVEMSEEALLDVVSAGVKSLYSKSLRSFDVS